MAASEHPESDVPALPEDIETTTSEGEQVGGEAQAQELHLDVQVAAPSACERKVTVTIDRTDIERYFDKEFSELVGEAQVPGFRKGHAPRKLVESRFRKDVAERVKNNLLMDSIGQVTKEQQLAAISEADFDPRSVVLPDSGPMTYEFKIEVRPEFDIPEWKGLSIERPVHEVADADVETALRNLLANHGELKPHHGAAEVGDYISTSLTFSYQGKTLSSAAEELIRIRPVLSFRDGKIEQFDQLMAGVRAGDTRVGEAAISEEALNEQLRGQKVTATFEIKDVKRLELPEMNAEFLRSVGDFDSEAELRDAIRDTLDRQLQYEQHRRARDQIARALTVSAQWELPPSLLKRQAEREMARAVLEMERSGFRPDEIRARQNELRQRILPATARALKEHFILERIAEEQNIEVTEQDYDDEIELIAEQRQETPRRVRARLEKSGQWDVLHNQIVERKVIELILADAKFVDVPYRPEETDAEAVDHAATGNEPEAEAPATPE